MWIGVLWAGLRASMWITHVGVQFRHGLLDNSLIYDVTTTLRRFQELQQAMKDFSGRPLLT